VLFTDSVKFSNDVVSMMDEFVRKEHWWNDKERRRKKLNKERPT